jgi:capsular polysaccharide biosynthesis protein
MVLKEYLNVVKKYLVLVVAIVLVSALASFFLSFYRPITYDASISFAVNRINKEKTPDYQYDGYYAIQASDLVSQTVVSWFATPSVVLEIYNQAGLSPAFESLDKFATLFHTKKYSGQNIGVKFNMADKLSAEKISNAAVTLIADKVANLNKNSDNQALFEIVASPPVIVENKANALLITLIGLVTGLILGLLLVYVIDFFKADKPTT